MATGLQDVAYIWHKDYLAESDKFLPTSSRNEMVHSLIESYGLLCHMKLVKPRPATSDEMSAFHSVDYLNHLKNAGDESTNESGNVNLNLMLDFLMRFLSPKFINKFHFIKRMKTMDWNTIARIKMACLNIVKKYLVVQWMLPDFSVMDLANMQFIGPVDGIMLNEVQLPDTVILMIAFWGLHC